MQLKHKRVLKKISVNIGKGMSLKRAMKEEGYSESYADSGHIKDTKSWEDLLEQNLPVSNWINQAPWI